MKYIRRFFIGLYYSVKYSFYALIFLSPIIYLILEWNKGNYTPVRIIGLVTVIIFVYWLGKQKDKKS